MAIQIGFSVALAFAVGRALYPSHWNWMVLTADIVCSGTRNRADVLHKSVLRVAGAAVGTAVATVLAGAFAPGDEVSIALIFAVIFLASWLRHYSYAYWAACVTAALALPYGYFGQTGSHTQ